MLTKINRCDRKTVEKAFKYGRFLAVGNLGLRFFLEKNQLPPRVSFVVPKSLSKKAVIRNRLRRRGYTQVAQYLGSLPPGATCVFVFGKDSVSLYGGSKNKKKEFLDGEIKKIINKIG